MSHKIQIDLCELFEVKEGQEFYIDSHEVKYKIENNKLMVETINGWGKSKNNIAWLLQEHEIEILKPETPPEIKKILQAFYDMGLRYFYQEDCFGRCCFDGVEDLQLDILHTDFNQWFETLNKPSGNTCNIKDYI